MISGVVWSGASCGDAWDNAVLSPPAGSKGRHARRWGPARHLKEVASANIGFFGAHLGHRSDLL